MSFFRNPITTVGGVMASGITSIKKSTSASKAAELMRTLNVGFLPVVDENGRAVGALTDRDLALRAIPTNLPGSDIHTESIMTKNAVSCRADMSLRDAAKLMQSKRVRRLIVNDAAENPIGILSTDDLARTDVKTAMPTFIKLAQQIKSSQRTCCE